MLDFIGYWAIWKSLGTYVERRGRKAKTKEGNKGEEKEMKDKDR